MKHYLLITFAVILAAMQSALAFADNELKAAFSTDYSKTSYLTQNFDDPTAMDTWTVGEGWALKKQTFATIDAADKYSLYINYSGPSGTHEASTTLATPEFEVKANSSVEFYAYFQGYYLLWGDWTFSVIDEDGTAHQLMSAFAWAQANSYDGPSWNKFSFSLADYAGQKIKLQWDYTYGGEDLTIDGFAVSSIDASSKDPIHIFEGDSITFYSMCEGTPDAIEWTLPGGNVTTSTEANPVVKYGVAGTYDVTLTAKRGDETATDSRKEYIVVSKRTPKAKIGLPEDGYESPYVGVFVPTGVPVTFTDQSLYSPTYWNWQFQFADKSSSTEQNPTVTFTREGTVSVALTAGNDAGSTSDMLQYAIQAGGAQYVWNISTDENSDIEQVAMGWYGNYAGTNWLGMDRFAEKYKAPLADATIDSVAVYFASTTTVSPDSVITLTVNSVDENGAPGAVIASSQMKVSELKYDDEEVVETMFHLDHTANLKKGEEYFVTIGPFPNNSLEVSPYTSDDIAILCHRRGEGEKCTAWHYLAEEDDNYQYTGNYSWVENVDDPLSMCIAPVVDYNVTPSAIAAPLATGITKTQSTRIFTLDGRQVNTIAAPGIYVVRNADGTTRKVLKR